MALHLRLNPVKSCGKFFENAHDKKKKRKNCKPDISFASVLAQRSAVSFLLNTRKSKIIELCIC